MPYFLIEKPSSINYKESMVYSGTVTNLLTLILIHLNTQFPGKLFIDHWSSIVSLHYQSTQNHEDKQNKITPMHFKEKVHEKIKEYAMFCHAGS